VRTLSSISICGADPFPHKTFSELKTELVKHGRNYAAEALGYRDKIAELSLGFIKDDSVVGASFRDAMI
jgi:translation initiation factor eIF-2B subunit alpha